MVNFIVVHVFSPYIEILAQLFIHAMGVVPSTLHLKVKFPTDGERGSERSSAMLGSRDHSWGQAEGVDRVSPLIEITGPQALHWADKAEELDKIHILLELDRYF